MVGCRVSDTFPRSASDFISGCHVNHESLFTLDTLANGGTEKAHWISSGNLFQRIPMPGYYHYPGDDLRQEYDAGGHTADRSAP